jgi:hypothetical protein
MVKIEENTIRISFMQVEKYNVTSIISNNRFNDCNVKFFKMAKEISKVVKLQVREVLRIHRHRLTLGAAGVNIMEFCKQFNARTQDKPAKYAQYKLLCIKTNHLIVASSSVMEAAKLKSGSEPNRKKSS